MKRNLLRTIASLALTGLALPLFPAFAGGSHAVDMADAVKSPADAKKSAAFDILAAHVHRKGRIVTFHMTTQGKAGTESPKPAGKLAGAPVFSYVWPTSLDPSVVGFKKKTGILALAATSHPDFDDTPLYDENGDGDPGNDGIKWHSHWVVLTPTKACGKGALGVRDIPKGASPAMPATWPGLPIYIDSPGFTPLFNNKEVTINVSFANPEAAKGASFDGVSAALKVNASVHAPLLCVTNVFDVASGNLSLPGKIK